MLIEALLALAEGKAAVVVHDVDTRPEWRSKYGHRVPVVEHGGQILCEFVIDEEAVLRTLAADQTVDR